MQAREAAYPLLLQDGDSLQLTRQPNHIYLLPPVAGIPETEKLILCQYPRDPVAKAAIQIICWDLSDKQGQQLTPLDNTLWEVEESPLKGQVNTIEMGQLGHSYSLIMASWSYSTTVKKRCCAR